MSRPRSMIRRAFSLSRRRLWVATRYVSERSFVSWPADREKTSIESPTGFHFLSRLVHSPVAMWFAAVSVSVLTSFDTRSATEPSAHRGGF